MKIDANLTRETTLIALLNDIVQYSAWVGLLNFLVIQMRPDISSPILTLSQFIANPNKSHWEALERVFAYLKETLTRNPIFVRYRGGLQDYTNSDWARDRSERKSTSGYIFLFQGAPISWKAKRQICVALSSAEAEYIAASEAVKEALYFRLTLNTFLLMDK
jgi:hypothetical protein